MPGSDGAPADPDDDLRLIASLRPRVGSMLLIDRPAGFNGHAGGSGVDFALAYGDALVRLALGKGSG